MPASYMAIDITHAPSLDEENGPLLPRTPTDFNVKPQQCRTPLAMLVAVLGVIFVASTCASATSDTASRPVALFKPTPFPRGAVSLEKFADLRLAGTSQPKVVRQRSQPNTRRPPTAVKALREEFPVDNFETTEAVPDTTLPTSADTKQKENNLDFSDLDLGKHIDIYIYVPTHHCNHTMIIRWSLLHTL